MLGIVTLIAAASVTFSGSQPQLASVGNRVYLTFGRGHVISVASSADGGTTFAPAVDLPVAGRLSLGMRRGPRIAATTDALIVSAVVGARGGGADGDILLFRSTDHGATWSAPATINDVPGSAREGMHAMAASPTGLVVIAWLDLRHKGTQIYAAVSRDHGKTWAPDALVYSSPSGSVCECCHPSVSIDESGRVAVMFRNNLAGNRDMYVARSSDGIAFSPATKLGAGSWPVNACPMDGGAIAFTGTDIVAVWRRDDGVFLSSGGAPEQRLATGRDPVIGQAGNNRDVAWSSAAGVVLWRGAGDPMPVGGGRFPSLLSFPGKTVIAWEEAGQLLVRTIAR